MALGGQMFRVECPQLRGAAGGILVFWDNRVLELVGLEAGMYLISCHFKNCEDSGFWIFIEGVWPGVQRNRESFWDELGVIRG